MDIHQLTTFFQWMTIMNIILIFISTILWTALKKWVYSMHGKLFNLTPEQMSLVAYQYLAIYKVLLIVFNLVPYLALTMLQP